MFGGRSWRGFWSRVWSWVRLICAISAAIVVMVVTVPERGWLVAAFVAPVAAAVVYSLLGILSWWFDWSDLAD